MKGPMWSKLKHRQACLAVFVNSFEIKQEQIVINDSTKAEAIKEYNDLIYIQAWCMGRVNITQVCDMNISSRS